MNHLQPFDLHRSLLFSIAYRMLGSVMEAEDILQETFLRWQDVPVEEVESARAYLATMVTRLCIDHLRSARVRREEYIGPWLPEPLIADPMKEPFQAMAFSESLSMAFLVILESLTPDERAAFLLREVFDYDYDEIARILEKTGAACRQLVSRARRHIDDRRPRYEVSPEQQMIVLDRFNQAIVAGEMQGLLSVLSDNVQWVSDGGGLRGVARKPVRGPESVARFILNLVRQALPRETHTFIIINGQPGLVAYANGRPYLALAIEISGDTISGFRAVANPDKLRHLPSQDNIGVLQLFPRGDTPPAGVT